MSHKVWSLENVQHIAGTTSNNIAILNHKIISSYVLPFVQVEYKLSIGGGFFVAGLYNTIHSAWSESVSRPGCMSQLPPVRWFLLYRPCWNLICWLQSSFSMNDSSSSSQRHVIIDLRCSVLLLLLQNVPNRK